MAINSDLYHLYNGKWNDFLSMKNQLDNEGITNYSSPLLMYCWEAEYNGENKGNQKKILFVGQETNSWFDCGSSLDKSSLNKVISNYKDFELGCGYNSPFWNFIKKLNSQFNSSDLSFLWTNVNKFGLHDGKGRPDSRVLELENSNFNILKDEIQIVSPDAVIFLSGPNYDSDIKKKLGSTKFIQCLPQFDKREFAQVENVYLPKKSFRIYHPNYLQYKNKTDEYLNSLIALL